MESQSFFSKGYVQILMTLVLVSAVGALGSYAYYTIKQTEGVYTGATTITVQGEGEVQVKPDIGKFSFSVRAEGKNAAEAQTKSAESINAILGALKSAGVDEKDIKTDNYNLNPKYKYVTAVCTAFNCPPSNPVIDGYEVSQTVTVKVRNLDKAGDLISKAGEKGATDMSNLQFTVDDEKVSKAQAREKAIVDAKEKAQVLAKNLNVRLLRMTGFFEDQAGGYPVMEGGYAAKSATMSADFKPMSPVMPVGENTVKATVSISYEVK